MHYGCPSCNRIKAQVSMDLFLIEFGRAHQPFDESFQQYHSTSSWVKSIWQKVATADMRWYWIISTTPSQEWVTNGSCMSLKMKISNILHKNYGWTEFVCTSKCCSCQIYFVSRARRLMQSERKGSVWRMKNGLSSTSPLRLRNQFQGLEIGILSISPSDCGTGCISVKNFSLGGTVPHRIDCFVATTKTYGCLSPVWW